MVDTSEKDFEASIEAALLGSVGGVRETPAPYGEEAFVQGGYVTRKPEQYDRTLCLIPEDVIGFLMATQPKEWDKLKTQYGEKARERFLQRLASEIEKRGTLDVLRKGVKDVGARFELAYFRPETTLNEEHQRLYLLNIFSVMRQCHYSQRSESSVDLVLFLNGLPLITAELKNPLKGQTVEDAIRQYREDRDQKEPLFRLGRCLAHFAVDTDLVFMTTHLTGSATRFLPFNLGYNGGAGNPVNPHGFKTSYLWERIWQKDSLLEIIAHFVQQVEVEDENGKKTGEQTLIFPRYHQWEAVRRLVAHARDKGPGQNYLIQHSAGSGKSNTIAWLVHRLAGLHDQANRRVFDTIIVVTDRRVLDRQLQRTIRSFDHPLGTLVTIESNKSLELAKALEAGKQIIVTTLQTFPFVSQKLGEMPSRRFAVVIDEAHSSQSGETSASLRAVLAAKDLEEAAQLEASETPDQEDAINAQVEQIQKQRGRLKNVSFFAFTATPKAKTLELFGTERPDGRFDPFSLYSMRQAIEEGFILDVLRHYTTYKTYFALVKKIQEDPEYDRKKAIYLLRSYASLHPHAIAQKTRIMVEHFCHQVQQKINGQAKAMVVARSRLHAVRFKQGFDQYLRETRLPFKALVAFSGEVTDPDTGVTFTENGMNGFPESQTAETFKKAEYRFLIVAEKFQTGFDQPLLHTMYVDKKLSGVHAVQTLSRLNRVHPDKEDTLVLDFENEADDILEAFQPYYETTLLSEATDPNKLYDLQHKMEGYKLYEPREVEAFACVYFSLSGRQEQLQPILNEVVRRYIERPEEERVDFRKCVGDYVRLYAFLSQLITFQDVELEKLYQFARHLLRKLPVSQDELPTAIKDNINMDSYRIQLTSSGEIRLLNEEGELQPITDLGTGRPTTGEQARLSEIIDYINHTYGTEFTTEDKLQHFADDMERRLAVIDALRQALDPENVPSAENRRLAFNQFFNQTLEDMIDSNFDIYKKIADDPTFRALFQAALFTKLNELQVWAAPSHRGV